MSTGVPWPGAKVTVNLAPSQQRKAGSGLDLAIAVGVLVASERLPADAIRGLGFLGELGLDGSIRPVPGVAPMAGREFNWWIDSQPTEAANFYRVEIAVAADEEQREGPWQRHQRTRLDEQ